MQRSGDGEFVSAENEADVTASELAAYAFCAKAWHLERVLGKAPARAAAQRRTRGVAEHLRHGRRVRRLQRAGRLWAAGSIALLLLATVLVIAAIVLSRS